MSRTVLNNDWYGTYIEAAQVDFVLIPLQLLSRLEPLPSTTPSQLTEEVDYGVHHQIVTMIAKLTRLYNPSSSTSKLVQKASRKPGRMPFSYPIPMHKQMKKSQLLT